MPELPEAEVCRDQLSRWSAGRMLDEVILADPAVIRKHMSSRPSDQRPDGAAVLSKFEGHPAGEVQRHGKRLGWVFGPQSMLIHLGMTGHWVKRPAGPSSAKSARLGLRFGDDTLWLMARRRMACVVPTEASTLDRLLVGRQGPDALDSPLTGAQLAVALRSRRPVKVLLMEQDRIAGLGNIHAAEACYRAGIHPATPADSLDATQWERLAEGITAQLTYTLGLVDPDAETLYVTSGAANPFAVYKRDGQPCANCGAVVASNELNGRMTYWCPRCQARAADA